MRRYRLPNNNTTTSETEYKDEWRELGYVVEDLFPGYTLTNYDPALRFVSQDSSDFFVLTPKAVYALKSALRAMRENR